MFEDCSVLYTMLSGLQQVLAQRRLAVKFYFVEYSTFQKLICLLKSFRRATYYHLLFKFLFSFWKYEKNNEFCVIEFKDIYTLESNISVKNEYTNESSIISWLFNLRKYTN